MKKIIILGGRGDGTVVLSGLQDLIDRGEQIEVIGFLNDSEKPGEEIEKIPVLGKLEEAGRYLHEADVCFISALLKAKEACSRSRRIVGLRIPTERFYTAIHPRATVARSARIGFGTFLAPNVVVMPKAVIGNHCSFRAGASIGHDCVIGHFAYVGPNATLSGGVILCDGVHVGPNASIRERVTCGAFSVIGMGSVVLQDIPEYSIVVGNPARLDTKTQPTS